MYYSNENQQNDNTSHSYQHNGDTYEYVFKGGEPNGYGAPPPPRRSRGRKVFVRLLAASLCVVLLLVTFGFGYGRGQLAGDVDGSGEPEGDRQPGQIQEISPNEDALHATPEDFLIKADSTSSPFGSAGEDVFAISQVVKMVEDAVVVIDTTVTNDSAWGTTTGNSSGSGVIISDNGYILTCNHVIEGGTSVLVTLNNGKQYEATLVGQDANTDLAVLKIEAEEPLAYAKHGSSADLITGEYVIAIGNPLGTLGGTVTKGIISATERRIRMSDGTIMTLLQTDAAINSGNSGGGLFNLKGELIGIVNAKYTATGVEGLGFAIPVDTAYEIELDLIRYGYVRGRVDHGLTMFDVTESNLRSYYYYYKIKEVGLYVSESKYSDKLLPKDRILSVNGVLVNTEAELWSIVSQCEVGDAIDLRVSRSGETFSVSITLREMVPAGMATTAEQAD